MNEVDPAFLAFLQEEENRAYDGTLLEEVEAAIRSYNGDDYGDEEEGRSQVVARDVAESVDYMLTSLVDVMAGSDNIIELEPQSRDDAEMCDDATQALHILYRKKQGFRVLHDWAKAGLMEKIAIIKTCAEQKKRRTEGVMDALNMPEDPRAEGIIEATPVEGAVDEMGDPTHFHVAALEDGPVQFNDYHVPLEEFGFSPDTTHDLDCSPYLNHHPLKTISQLIEMGYPREDVEGLADNGGNSLSDNTSLSQARDDGRQSAFPGRDRQGVLRQVRYLEEYTFYDLDGDGIAERIKVCRVGNTILNVEPIEDQPFEVWCSFPMQGRLIGQSFADKTMDIQRVNTVLERNMLDSLYFQTAPGTFVHEDSVGAHTIDDLLTVRPGRIVRYTGSEKPIPEVRQDVSQIAMAAIEFKIRQRESRTGITRLNKGIDEDALNDTARGQQQLMTRGQQMERYVIRQYAEGFGRLASKKVRLMRRHGQPFQIRVDGEYKQIDPKQWPEDFDIQIKVGLGSGSKDERIMARQMIGQAQSLLKQSGSPIVTDDNIYNNAVGLARDFGLQPNDLFTEPPKDEQGNPVPQQQPPDPKAQALMAELQMKQQQLQQSQQEGEAKLQLMAAKHASDAQIAAAKAEQEAQLAVRQQDLQTWLATEQMKLEQQRHSQAMAHADEQHQAKVSSLRAGGALNK